VPVEATPATAAQLLKDQRPIVDIHSGKAGTSVRDLARNDVFYKQKDRSSAMQ
jgi:hypothetical protein